MAKKPNKVRRGLITALIVLFGVAIVIAFARSAMLGASRGASTTTTSQTEQGAETPAQPDVSGAQAANPPRERVGEEVAEEAEEGSPTLSAPRDAAPEAQPPEGVPAALRLRVLDQQPGDFGAIGSTDEGQPYRMRVAFSPYGAGVESIVFRDYFTTIERNEHYAIQERKSVAMPSGARQSVVSLAAVAVELTIAGERYPYIDLRGVGAPAWAEVGRGAFEAVIEDDGGAPVARIFKRYLLDEESFELRVEQRLENLTPLPMQAVWLQYGPVDLPADQGNQLLDPRRFRAGFLRGPSRDPRRTFVHADSRLLGHNKLVDFAIETDDPVWPRIEDIREGHELVWAAMTSRYFAFAVHTPIDAQAAASGAPVGDKAFDLAAQVIPVVVGAPMGAADTSIVLQLESHPFDIAPGASADLSFGAYAGPMARSELNEPLYRALGLDRIVVYNLGSFCAFCTFQWLADILIAFLNFAHDYLVFDWALAIILLVIVVRTILHPVTKRSQVALARFTKQMQALAPKQKALQEKYKDDPKRLQAEMAKLMREEGVSFTGALGCLPMFLQSPVWIALYASLYFVFELRHEPAFFGVFQALTNGRWAFLADLSAPDHFIEFGRTIHVPLLSGLMGGFTGLNILPLLLGVVFYIQQKYMTPPASATMTPEQQAQQKMIKVMMVVLFPVFIYNQASALTLYFVTNSALGILESRWIRAHINTLDLETPKPKRQAERKRVRNAADRAAMRLGKGRDPKPQSFKGRGRGSR